MTIASPSLRELLDRRPDIQRVEAFVTDVNGIARGKWLPREKGFALDHKGMLMPRSCFALDIWGRDVEAAGLAFGTGDPDGLCREVAGSACELPWAGAPMAQVMLAMEDADGTPFFADPRALLVRVEAALRAASYRAVVATELEFYLVDAEHPVQDPLRPPHGGSDRWQRLQGQVLSTDMLHVHEALLSDIAAACASQAVPLDAMVRENGPGQYELNLRHVDDAVAAADHAILFKRIVKGTARRHGLRATFMAKPYGDHSGSGMHVHTSLLDRDGLPAFVDGHGAPCAILDHAVAGLVASLPSIMLMLAPHANSYRRFRPNSHAPTFADWGHDDRSAAVRIIHGEPYATRIEHRVAGADANPYLTVAAILAGITDGIVRASPKRPEDEARRGSARRLPVEWGAAIDSFADSPFATAHFGEAFCNVFLACKRQDFDGMLSRVSDVEYDAYRDLA